jgi:hypothetical protein
MQNLQSKCAIELMRRLSAEGICDVAGKQKRVVKTERLYECPRTGSVTDYVQLSTDRGVSWEEAIAMLENQKIYSAEHDLIDDRSGFCKYVRISCANIHHGI